MVTADLLRRYSHFSQLSPEALEKLASIADEQTVAAGQAVFAESDPAEYLYLIVRGEVNLACELGSGEFRVVDTLVDGELVGWASLVEPYRCRTVGTAVKETHFVRLAAPKLRAFCDADHALGRQLLTQVARILSSRLKSARVQLAAV
jgi:CRP-like cAMP-binding protein